MYREFISETDRDEIIANYGRYGTNTPPHCNETMFHKPGTCAFCDGYYGLKPRLQACELREPRSKRLGRQHGADCR